MRVGDSGINPSSAQGPVSGEAPSSALPDQGGDLEALMRELEPSGGGAPSSPPQIADTQGEDNPASGRKDEGAEAPQMMAE